MKLATHYLIVEHNVTNAVEYLTMAAKNGSPEAAYDLGQLYSTYQEIHNEDLAKYWYTEAAKMGETNAIAKGFPR